MKNDMVQIIANAKACDLMLTTGSVRLVYNIS